MPGSGGGGLMSRTGEGSRPIRAFSLPMPSSVMSFSYGNGFAGEFITMAPTAPNFFRKGLIGEWRNVLSRNQVQYLVERHGPAMAELGCLEEAERFLARN